MVKKVGILVMCIGIMGVVYIMLFRFGPFSKQGDVKMEISSTLKDAANISELSTAEFRYRGIAELYKDEEKKKLQCRICYSAIVKAGVDFNKLEYEVDESNKTIIATLPDIDLTVTIVDEKSMAFLPSDTNAELDRILKCCEEDVKNEARASEQLIDTAQKNLKSTIERMLYHILISKGYKLEWA